MEYHEYRVFTDETIVLTAWRDNKTVVTVSTAFKAIQPEDAGEIRIRGHDLTGQKPLLSAEATKILATLPGPDLHTLAKMVGRPLGTGTVTVLHLYFS
jgi:hypothetical protein